AEARNKAGIKLRWPIREAYINGAKYLENYRELLQYLGNIKEAKTGSCPDGYIKVVGQVEVCIPDRLELELYHEALARELVRRIQVLRKEAGLAINDSIKVVIETHSEEIKKAVETFRMYVMQETRAVSIELATAEGGREWDISGEKVKIKIEKRQ
ncbi:MAG: DUF5915 domain-containing protein, partial [Pyrobaculum sp.]